ncbi:MULTISPECIES: YitT family protein [Spirosoma]|uniref:YitT family protein n=1 Tax=Spirosoma liriopis TaxID=2937440 RepID=A0ABT0HR83_9BACT|nr:MULTISPECIES: YitT family protein [Spirosoma]MCK8494332.1 YitT family protein [Spirosoma liriopis]UHG89344.1 YitT family protein [Spirosoma oryzicola]
MIQHSATYRIIKDTLFITAGVLGAGMGIKGFLLSSHFIDGGVTGISMLLASLFNIPLPIWLLLINLPFIGLGYRQFGRQFALKSTLGIAGLSLSLAVIPFPDVTPDFLLTSVFGGFFIGAGIGLAMRGGAVLDGTEIAALLISRSSHIFKVSDVILVLNVVIFSAAAFFLGVNPALYSMITYFAASKTVDFVIHGIEEYTAVLIVSKNHVAIREQIIECGWGVTVLKAEEGYGKHGSHHDLDCVLYVVLTRLELSRLRNMISIVDPTAFVIQHTVDDVAGGKVKSLPLH